MNAAKLSKINYQFTLSLIDAFEQTNGSSSSNLFISPFALHSALTLIATTTTNKSKNEMLKFLG